MKTKPLTETDLSTAADFLHKAVELEKEAAALREQAARVMRLAPPLPLPRMRLTGKDRREDEPV
jgi:hypothetical protein